MLNKLLIAISFVLVCNYCFPQKYNFVNWTVEDGLIQSQASYLCQDQYRHLWVATLGGVCRFDGKSFKGYTMQDGLLSNHTNILKSDSLGNLWIGTNYGISVFNGSEFKNIELSTARLNNVTEIINLTNESVFSIADSKLFLVKNFKAQKQFISNDTNERVISIYKSSQNQLLAIVYKKGLYCFSDHKWKMLFPFDASKNISCRKIFISKNCDTILVSNAGLYKIKSNSLQKIIVSPQFAENSVVHCVAEDSNGNLWVGTNNGAYKIKNNHVQRFDAKNGLTDNSVFHITVDAENNIWFATDADGVFKYRENMFTWYDKVSGLSNPSIMGIVKTTDKQIYAAGYGGILHKITESNTIESIPDKDASLSNNRINCLYADDNDNVWIGTVGGGAWSYKAGKGFKKINYQTENNLRTITCFLKDVNNTLLIGSPQGLYKLEKNEILSKIQSVNTSVNSLLMLGDSSILAGTPNGVFILNKNYDYTEVIKKECSNSSILCLAKNEDIVWMGTTNKGVLCWNTKTGKIINYSKKDGLPNDFIYFINADEKNKVLVGTGYGVCNLSVNSDGKLNTIESYGKPDGLIGMECNNNAVLKSSDSTFWFGTAKGLFHFNPNAEKVQVAAPFILFKSLKLFSSDIKDSSLYERLSAWFNIPQQLILSHHQNNLTFEFGAIYFTNPFDIYYKYKLEGLDKDYVTASNGVVNYSALPPGKYTLKAKAFTKTGIPSSNEINYSFQINKAFYQTTLFQILVVFLLIATGAFVMYLFERKKQKHKLLFQKIREEEFNKLRQRTAEDFHDEMGNKLTRISVLADILKSKLDSGKPEPIHLIDQIKDNTGALYNGSRDIIWSLNSQNDGLLEIVERINEKGLEMYAETNIDFMFTHNVNSVNSKKLKLDYSRNIIMIFKEVYNNILKHSNANQVKVSINISAGGLLTIFINDNGKGFDVVNSDKGNGLKNIKNRVTRLNGLIEIKSSAEKGTEIQMSFKELFI